MKSMCQDVRRNSPSVAERSPTSACMATMSRIASSSAAFSCSAEMRPAAWSERACSSAGGRSRLPTWSARKGGTVREAIVVILEGVGGDVAPDRDPSLVGEGIEVGRAAEAGAGAGVPHAAERGHRLVVDGLVVDVDDAGRDPLGQGQ